MTKHRATNRVSRGGGRVIDAAYCRAAYRANVDPNNVYGSFGLRCARTQSTRLYRVYRGGDWFDGGATNLAARARFGSAPSYRVATLGFRCARCE